MQQPVAETDDRFILRLPPLVQHSTFEFLAGSPKTSLPGDEVTNLDTLGQHILVRTELTLVCRSWASFFKGSVSRWLTSWPTASLASQGSLEDLRKSLLACIFSLLQRPPQAEGTATSPLGPLGILPGFTITTNGVAVQLGSPQFPRVPSVDQLVMFSKWLFRMPWMVSIKSMTIHHSPGDYAFANDSWYSSKARRRAMAKAWVPVAGSYDDVLTLAKKLAQAYLSVTTCSQVERAIGSFRLDSLALDSDGTAQYSLFRASHSVSECAQEPMLDPESIKLVFEGHPIMTPDRFAVEVHEKYGDVPGTEYYRRVSLLTWHAVRCSRQDEMASFNETPECRTAHLKGEWRRDQTGHSAAEFAVDMYFWETGAAEDAPAIVLHGIVAPLFETTPVANDMLDSGVTRASDSITRAETAVAEAVTMDDIVHGEPPAVLSEAEAADVSNAQWAGFLDHLNAHPADHSVQSGQPNCETGQQEESIDCMSDSADHASGSDITASRTLQTAPAAAPISKCLLPNTQVVTSSGRSVNAADLKIDDELLAGCGQAIVRAVRCFPARDRDIIQITFASATDAAAHEQLVVTASHVLSVFEPSSRKTEPVLASEVTIGQCLRTPTLPVKVISVTKSTIRTSVFEIELRHSSSTMYISTGSTPVETFGATLPKLKHSQVKILSFNRYDKFRESLFENEELEACRQAICQAGFNIDLSVYELGPGKMLVRANLVESVLQALHSRPKLLGRNCVVVSSELEPIVKLAAQNGAGRSIFVRHEEILDLPRKSDSTRDKRTFLDLSSSSCEGSGVVCSTTDMDKKKGKNPRRVRLS